MRSGALAVVVLLALLAPPALAASFSGTIEMRISAIGDGPSGTVKLTTAEAGTLTETSMMTPVGPMKMKMITRAAKPGILWLVDDARRTITEMSTASTGSEARSAADDEAWTVKRLGTENVAGYSAVHVRATGARSGTELELWTSREVMSGERYRAAFGQESRMTSNMPAALKKEGAHGFPVRLVSKERDGSRVTFELIKATAGTPPASTFELPAGYTTAALPQLPGIPPEAAKMLEQQMKQMTPEQREMMRKMMQGQ